MATRPHRPRDPNQLARMIVALSTGEQTDPLPSKRAESGRAGGLKGGKTRMAGLDAQERSALGKKAAAKRWKKSGE